MIDWPSEFYDIEPGDPNRFYRWKRAIIKGSGKDFEALQELLSMNDTNFHRLSNRKYRALLFCRAMLGWKITKKPIFLKTCCRRYPLECGGVCCSDLDLECQCDEIDQNSKRIVFQDNCYDDCCVLMTIRDNKKFLVKIEKLQDSYNKQITCSD